MLLTEKIEITVIPKLIGYWSEKLGKTLKKGDKIIVDTLSMPKNSKKLVKVKCDICGEEKEISIISYFRNIEKYDIYCCSKKCAYDVKNRVTNLERYGTDCYTKTEEFVKKVKMTKLERYGDENYTNDEKRKKTNLERYGDECYIKTDDFKRKKSSTMVEKYGVENALQGTYEKDFLDKYYNILNISKLDEPIEYYNNGEKHLYFPDFYLEDLNLIVEIKSTRWYNEHLEKNLNKEKYCKEKGYNFIFIIDKDYKEFDNLTSHLKYNKKHCWQYDIRLNTLEEDLNKVDVPDNLSIKDFEFYFVDKNDKKQTKEIVEFIKKYEWLGTMPNRPTHRFVAKYKGILAGVIVMSTPNSFSNILGSENRNIEKLISRGACSSWTPKNLASALISYSIKWMVKNTEFRVFSAYSDPEAKELGTIYQACNFYYLGNKFGSDKLYFDPKNPQLGWSSGRNFRKFQFYKNYLKEKNIKWEDSWNIKTKIIWENIPETISKSMKEYSKMCLNRCYIRKATPKHKYVYILGKDKKETKKWRKLFLSTNKIYKYPKNR